MNLTGKNVLVAGLGESGLAMTAWLLRAGARVTVVDSRSSPPNQAALEKQWPDVRLITGVFDQPETRQAFEAAQIIALSPGLSRQTPAIARAATAGIPVVSEIELFAWALRKVSPAAKIIAITGSNGKTTTTALTAHLVNAAGLSAQAAGNISPSALDALMQAIDTQSLPQVWVLELSSFQLETTETLAPDAATILNISEDHLDRYADLDDYGLAKARIFAGAKTCVINRNDARVRALCPNGAPCISFGPDRPEQTGDYGLDDGWLVKKSEAGYERLIAFSDLKLIGAHNAGNALAALALVDALHLPDYSPHRVLPALAAFKGLAHRVEHIACIDGVDFIDDSKGTNVGATLAAIIGLGQQGSQQGTQGRLISIVLGGDGKGQDFRPLGPALAQHARAIALIGRDASLIEAAIPAACAAPRRYCADLPEAVRWLAAQSRPGDAVLLSPACASMDMFKDYAHRARVFIDAVHSLAQSKAHTLPGGQA